MTSVGLYGDVPAGGGEIGSGGGLAVTVPGEGRGGGLVPAGSGGGLTFGSGGRSASVGE